MEWQVDSLPHLVKFFFFSFQKLSRDHTGMDFGCTSNTKKNTAAPNKLTEVVQRNSGYELFAWILFNGTKAGYALIHEDCLDGTKSPKSKLVKCQCLNCKDIDHTASPYLPARADSSPQTAKHVEVQIKHVSTWDETNKSFISVQKSNQILAKIILKDGGFHNVIIRRELSKPNSKLNSMCVECETKFNQVTDLVKHFMKCGDINVKPTEQPSIKSKTRRPLFPTSQPQAASTTSKQKRDNGFASMASVEPMVWSTIVFYYS